MSYWGRTQAENKAYFARLRAGAEPPFRVLVEECEKCEEGCLLAKEDEECDLCHGVGSVAGRTCPACAGDGYTEVICAHDCDACDGLGFVEVGEEGAI